MKLKVYEEHAKAEVLLKLLHHYDGSVVLCAVDERGNQIANGNLLSIEKDGKVMFYPGVNQNLGFPLDADGELIIQE